MSDTLFISRPPFKGNVPTTPVVYLRGLDPESDFIAFIKALRRSALPSYAITKGWFMRSLIKGVLTQSSRSDTIHLQRGVFVELEVRIDRDSFSIAVGNPFRLDLDALMKEIEGVAASSGATLDGLDVKGLLPRMVRGVAGCEAGCPSNAKELVSRGFKNFALAYVEGGILTATCRTTDGKFLSFKLFPDF